MRNRFRNASYCASKMAGDWFIVLAAVFVITIACLANAAGRWSLAVYALSFWHYSVYALAFFCRDVPLERFKSDALLLKAIALVALALAFLMPLYSGSFPAAWPGLLALIAAGTGFGLNIIAARALGPDRTFYGYETGALPLQQITDFPYSHIPHPMLLGNMLAFGGLLLDDTFRHNWWPLALTHVALNFLILMMEIYGRQSRIFGVAVLYAALLVGALLLLLHFADVWHFAAAIAAACFLFAGCLRWRYTQVFNQRELEGYPS